MIAHDRFACEPWRVRETSLDLDVLAQTESVFALTNGHIGWRGNLDEGEPHGLPGSYLNGVFESRPLPLAEAGYGDPESGQTIIDVTNGKLIRLLVDDQPFDVRYGRLGAHERDLDFRSGMLTRQVEWTAPTGRTVRVRSQRLVSFTQRAIAAICYEVEPVDGPTRVVVQSELVANEQIPHAANDPRAAAALDSPLRAELDEVAGSRVTLVHSTRRSALRVACAMDHVVDCPVEHTINTESSADLGRTTVAVLLKPGQRLRLVKFVAYGWSLHRSLPGVRAQVEAALTSATSTGWDELVTEQKQFLDTFWAHADVELDGDPEVQQAVRFGLLHTVQAGARAEGRAIPAKGLTGPGYDGHCFWDSEIFVLPMLTYTLPEATAHALRWRYDTLPLALRRAEELGLRGAAFPWRTINGTEGSGYWPAGTAAFHINADIAAAVSQYVDATGDQQFHASPGLDLLVQTARLWISLGHFDSDGRFRIDGVTGPDEYSAVADNNVYTNLMARRNLLAAADCADTFPDRAAELAVTATEIADWRLAADTMFIPYDDRRRVHQQSEGFTQHQEWDFEHTAAANYPLLLNYPYFDLYRKQVVKQADLVLAMYLCPDDFTAEDKQRDFDYYERRTVRDSSLSACVQAVLAAEVGHLDLARDYLGEAALIDLADLQHNTRDGLHIASLAGSWLALVAGFGGMRHRIGRPLRFAPALPPDTTRLAFRLCFRGRLIAVEITAGKAEYTLLSGEPMPVVHYDQEIPLHAGESRALSIPDSTPRPAPSQPAGRAPLRHPPGAGRPNPPAAS
ncbi:MAG TPA: glycosyl hydrolase family 65 protein [Pseudonocardiaceae bacterium]|jgi:alpha,alpha-trehalose phosphorylase|nr:glycosyl hydrolase family 65 protein [Pseudonocardiaceae bacterium]